VAKELAKYEAMRAGFFARQAAQKAADAVGTEYEAKLKATAAEAAAEAQAAQAAFDAKMAKARGQSATAAQPMATAESSDD